MISPKIYARIYHGFKRGTSAFAIIVLIHLCWIYYEIYVGCESVVNMDLYILRKGIKTILREAAFSLESGLVNLADSGLPPELAKKSGIKGFIYLKEMDV